MSLRSWQLAGRLAATVAIGLMAGVFGLYPTRSCGLGKTGDRTFVGAFQAIDRAIINPLFMLTFMGAFALEGIAGMLYLRGADHSVLSWAAAAFALYLAAFVITIAIHVPLNDAIKAAGEPDRVIDLAAVRAAFHETRWIAWNIVRAVATTLAFGRLTWALVPHGRASADGDGNDARAVAGRQRPGHAAGRARGVGGLCVRPQGASSINSASPRTSMYARPILFELFSSRHPAPPVPSCLEQAPR
jgi:uncharacterized membrane protein